MMYFYWDVFNVFFGSIVFGSLTEKVSELVTDSGEIGQTLGELLPKSSNFFINYLALRALGLVPLKLLFHNAVFQQIMIVVAKLFRGCGPAALLQSGLRCNYCGAVCLCLCASQPPTCSWTASYCCRGADFSSICVPEFSGLLPWKECEVLQRQAVQHHVHMQVLCAVWSDEGPSRPRPAGEHHCSGICPLRARPGRHHADLHRWLRLRCSLSSCGGPGSHLLRDELDRVAVAVGVCVREVLRRGW